MLGEKHCFQITTVIRRFDGEKNVESIVRQGYLFFF